jgi:hypothetical protein
MSGESPPPRRIFVGLLPSAGSTVVYSSGSEDPVGVMVREANAKLDAERAAEAKALAAKAADIERAKLTRRARAARRLKRVIRMVLR